MQNPIATLSISEYKRKYNSSIEVIPSDNHAGVCFFACGTKQGKPNYGAIGSKALQVLQDPSLSLEKKAEKLQVCTYEVPDPATGEVKELDIIQKKGGKSIMTL